MRLLAASYLLAVVLLIDDSIETEARMIREKFYKYLLNKCLKEHNITVEQYVQASKRNNVNGIYDKAKCVDACMLGTLQIMKPDGSVDMGLALEHLLSGEPGTERDNMQKNIEKCNVKGKDYCDSAHKLMICALDKS